MEVEFESIISHLQINMNNISRSIRGHYQQILLIFFNAVSTIVMLVIYFENESYIDKRMDFACA